MGDILPMSDRALSRVHVLEQLKQRKIKQRQAAQQLGLSIRQVKRLLRAFKRRGAKALISKKRGQRSPHQLSRAVQAQAVELLHRHDADVGPTLAHEKLTEVHPLSIGLETVRQILIAEG